MFEIIQGILLILSFLGLVYYCFKGGNLLIGFVASAVLWLLIGRIPIEIAVNDVFSESVANYGATAGVIIFGAWFGRVIIDTGIAGYIIKKTVELAGDKPLFTAILLNIVCLVIFMSAFGVGSVMAIGMIVLPIMFTLGIDKKTALGTYMMAVSGGMWLNIAYVSQFFGVFPNMSFSNEYIHFAIIATMVHACLMVMFIVINYNRTKRVKVRTWAASVKNDLTRTDDLKWYSMMVPFSPIILVAVFGWTPIPSFMLSITLGLVLTGNAKTYKKFVEKIQKTLYDGFADVGLLLGMLYGVTMFMAAAEQVVPLLQSFLGDIIPTSTIAILIMFCILAPLALFRGPLMIWGSGIALASILQATGNFSESFLFMLFLVPPVAIVATVCPTQSWGAWALSYVKIEPKDYIKKNLPWGWSIAVIVLILGYVLIGSA